MRSRIRPCLYSHPDGVHAVIFDIDGTLLESVAADDSLYRNAVFNVLGDVRLRSSLYDYEHISDSGILSQVLADNGLDDALFVDVKSEFMQLLRRHIDECGPFIQIPGADDMLLRLKASDQHEIAIATGGWRESAELKLRSAGIFHDDVPLATSNDAPERTAIMEIALDHIGGDFETITYYGDGTWDEAACRELGWRFVPVGPALDGLTSYEELPM